VKRIALIVREVNPSKTGRPAGSESEEKWRKGW
jgi:hypothetical protein